MACTCKVGPGRFEGEGAITAIVHSWEDGGDYLSYGDGAWARLELGPFSFIGEEEHKAAEDAGFCADCIKDAEEELLTAKAITYGGDSQGFLWSQTWDSAKAAQEAYDADEAEMQAADDEQEQEG